MQYFSYMSRDWRFTELLFPRMSVILRFGASFAIGCYFARQLGRVWKVFLRDNLLNVFLSRPVSSVVLSGENLFSFLDREDVGIFTMPKFCGWKFSNHVVRD